MALWCDPLDELIDQLDRAIPASPPGDHALFDLVLMQRWTTTFLYGDDEPRAQMEREPWYQEWLAQWQRFTARPTVIPRD